VAVASGELYGPPPRLPVDEHAALRPQNPYAVSKAAADLLAGFYADAHGMRVIRARAFNHAGPGQAPIYAIATFARQVAVGLEAGDDPIRVVTGNPDTRRDYTDVRDVVRAYRALAADGTPGEAYNVCSGRPASAAELVEWLGEAAGVPRRGGGGPEEGPCPRGDGAARLPREAHRRDGLGTGDPAAPDAARHGRVVAGGAASRRLMMLPTPARTA
jgi:nucleoside-diphosphate-sugar epimerase